MDLYPQNLGSKWHFALARTRTPAPRGRHLSGLAPTEPPAKKRLGPLGKFWTGGTKMDTDTAADGLASLRARTLPLTLMASASALLLVGGSLALAADGQMGGMAVTAGMTAFYGSLGLLIPRFLFQRIHNTPLTAREVETLLPTVRDDLERAFLTLVIDAIRQPPSPIPSEAQQEMRSALRALGDAIEKLPAAAAAAAPPAGNAGDLRQEAARVRAEAAGEPDPVTQASLERQAEALLRRAEAWERAATLLRRASVLRREMTAQTEALRAGLAGFHTGATDTAGLAILAETVRSIAAEASSVAGAREELDAAASAALPAAALKPDTAPPLQQAGVGRSE